MPEDTDIAPGKPAAKAALKKMPGFSQGVRTNSAMRMMKLAAPICPNSKIEMERQPNGGYVPKPRSGNSQNCQLAGGKWWELCESLGHNPYFRTNVWYETVDDWDEETGVLNGTKRIRHKEVFPNINQVPIARRMHNGNGVITSMEKKGRKRLKDLGFEEVCQFRNCQKPVNPKARSKAFGEYCSAEHLSLIAADAQSIFLTQITGVLESGIGGTAEQNRKRQLREAVAFADLEDA